MPFDIGSVGTQAASTAGGAIIGLALEKHNDKRQIKQQQKLTNMQTAANKDMAQFNYEQQMKMWNDTNYSAQKGQMEKAGLNPALMYGMSGGGGATTAAAEGAGASGGSAPQGGREVVDQMGLMTQRMQLELLGAQKQNIEADTANKQATTAKTSGVDTEKVKTETQSLQQGIANQKAAEQLTKIQAQLTQLNYNYESATLEDRIDTIAQQARMLTGQASSALIQAGVDEETKRTKIQLIRTEAIGASLRNILTDAQTKKTISDIQVNDQTIFKLGREIAFKWTELNQTDTKLAIEIYKAEIEAQYPGISQALGRIIDDGVNKIFQLTPQGERPTTKPMYKKP
jgi:hypothetical protein